MLLRDRDEVAVVSDVGAGKTTRRLLVRLLLVVVLLTTNQGEILDGGWTCDQQIDVLVLDLADE